MTLAPNQTLQLAGSLPPSNRTVVLDVGPTGSADSSSVFAPFVLREADGSYKMWYTGFDGSRDRILSATSQDGVNWTKRGVVMDVSSGAIAPSVMKVGAVYHMWFTDITWGMGPLGYLDRIYHATSSDGFAWSIQGLALDVGVSGAWDEATVSQQWVIQDSTGAYRMYYAGWNPTANVQIGLATSLDLITWNRSSMNPVLAWGPSGAWDDGDVASPCVVIGSNWTMYYGGRQNLSKEQIGVASSADGVRWSKDAKNPVIAPEAPPYWDNAAVSSPAFLAAPAGPRLYFAGWDSSIARIGEYKFGPPGPVSRQGTYSSPVFDSGATGTRWLSLNWSGTVPMQTSLSVRVRTGNSSIPNLAWSPWVPSASSLSQPRNRYIQVGIDFGSTKWNLTAIVQTVTVTYVLNDPPEVMPTTPTPGLWSNTLRPVLSWNMSDSERDRIIAERVELSQAADFSSVVIDSGNVPAELTRWQVPYALPDGTWYWRLQAQDAYGAWGVWQSSLFRLDSAAPTLSLSSPIVGSLLHSSTLDVVWTASDAASGLDHIGVNLDAGPQRTIAAGNSSAILDGLPDGHHAVTVTAYDRAGNTASIAIFFDVDTNALSLNGPYGAWPVISLVVIAVAATGIVSLLLYRHRKRPPSAEAKA